MKRRAWPFTAGLLVVLLIGAGMVAPRAIADPAPTGGTPFTVLSFNTYEGRADVDALADLIRTARPDVVALPEAGQRFASKLGHGHCAGAGTGARRGSPLASGGLGALASERASRLARQI